MAPRRKPLNNPHNIKWPANTELIGLRFVVEPIKVSAVNAPYTTGLHAWFLEQVRQKEPALSQRLHDEQTQKAFTISGLNGQFVKKGERLKLHPAELYNWTVTAFSRDVVYFLGRWLAKLPKQIALRYAPLRIIRVEIALPPTNYSEIRATLPSGDITNTTLSLSFVSPTSFRRKDNHFPLPLPVNLFQSYLRRWNELSGQSIEADPFLNWIDRYAVIQRVALQSQRVAVGKGKGVVTGFIGAIELGLDRRVVNATQEYLDYFHWLAQYAPYCGTGHKTAFGLGQTMPGWTLPQELEPPISAAELLEERIAELTELFFEQRKRQGGTRALKAAKTWAKILARREQGDSLIEIAADLEMKHDTVNRYAKLARAAAHQNDSS